MRPAGVVPKVKRQSPPEEHQLTLYAAFNFPVSNEKKLAQHLQSKQNTLSNEREALFCVN